MVPDVPALPPVPDVIRTRLLVSDAHDNEVGTSFFMSYSGTAPTITLLNTFATAVATAWNTDIAPLTGTADTLTTVDVADLTSSSSAVGSATVSHAGTRAGGDLPLSAAFSIQYHTLLRRRGGRWHGQQRWGTLSDLNDAQTWQTTFVSAALAGWTSFISAVAADVWSGGGTLAHVGVQYYGPPNKTHTSGSGRVSTVSSLAGTPGADLTAPVVWPVVGYGAFTRLGSQRKRLGKSGT